VNIRTAPVARTQAGAFVVMRNLTLIVRAPLTEKVVERNVSLGLGFGLVEALR
jgi:hypothetical protein